MPKLKVLSGKDVIKILESFNFLIAGQKGSHIKLKRNLPDGHSQSLTIPNHKELGIGTLKDIFNQATRYVAKEELSKHFHISS